MSNSENPFSHEALPSKEDRLAAAGDTSVPSRGPYNLRWWPALVLLTLMVACRISLAFVESPGLPMMMVAFFGPALLSFVMVGWWLFASRASVREKLIGLAGVAVLAVVTGALLHVTMLEIGLLFYHLPSGIGLFGLVLMICYNKPTTRLRTALVFAAVGFGFWDFLKSDGVTGKFDSEFSFRWSPTAEEQYLQSIATDDSTKATPASSPSPTEPALQEDEVVTRASSQWSDFRGPMRDGRQPNIVLNEDWKANPPKLIWKSRIGPGWSSFTVAGNRLFTQEQRGENEAVVCLNAETGSILWSYEYPGRFWEVMAGAGPRATPTVADDGLFALGAKGQLVCLNAVTGDRVWERDLQNDANCKPPQWGFSSSPLIHNGLVIVHTGGADDKGVLAYDAKTGEIRWGAASGNHSYSSPQLATFSGVEGILMETNNGLQFLNAVDGSLIWQHSWPGENYRALQPLVFGDSVLIATSLGLGTRRITIVHEGTEWKITEDWTSLGMKPDFNDFVEYQGHVYGFDGSIFACIDLETGKRLWKKGRYGSGQVLLLPDEGQLLVASETGDLVLLKANPKELEEVAKISAIEGKTWNHPVLVGNRLYIRNAEEAACFELTSK